MGEYLAVEIEPGKHRIYFSSGFDLFGLAAGGKVGALIHATPGSSHYFQMRWNGKYAEMDERPERDGREVVPLLKRRPVDLTQPPPAPPMEPPATLAPG